MQILYSFRINIRIYATLYAEGFAVVNLDRYLPVAISVHITIASVHAHQLIPDEFAAIGIYSITS